MGKIERGLNWSEVPGEAFSPSKYRIIRTPIDGKPITAIILNASLFGTPTHFYNRQTQPCRESECEGCARALKREWNGYVFGLSRKNGEAAVLEIKSHGAIKLAEIKRQRGTLRGLEIRLFRPSGKSNGRILLEVVKSHDNKLEWPRVPDARTFMESIWKINLPALPAGEQAHEESSTIPIPSTLGSRLRDLEGQRTFLSNGEH